MEDNGAMKLQAIEIRNKWPFWAVCVNVLFLNSLLLLRDRVSQYSWLLLTRFEKNEFLLKLKLCINLHLIFKKVTTTKL